MQPQTRDLADFVEAAPTSYHAAAEAARRLTRAGYRQQDRAASWDAAPGGHFVVAGGSVVAWWVPDGAGAHSAYRIIGTHTDSPSFKLKPNPQLRRHGWDQVGVEVYGGPLLASWTDRDLGLAGRVVDHQGNVALVKTAAVMRIPQLAVHLNRAVNAEGLQLDRQAHTVPVVGLGGSDLIELLVRDSGLSGEPVGFDVFAYDTQRPALLGAAGEMFASGRLDNLSSTHAALVSLVERADQGDDHGSDIRVMAAFDHEEVGSGTATGAAGPLLTEVLERTGVALGLDQDQRLAMLARSSCLSCDTGHLVHPNYPERHDPANHPQLNQGPLLKLNADQRYATDGIGGAIWARACADAGVNYQPFVSNNASPCGSTIGPITATRLGITVVDVGVGLLSMHSARELAGTKDLRDLAAALSSYLWS